MSFWEQAYSSGEYQKHWDYKHPSQELVAITATQLIRSGDLVADLGCGAGREAIYLAECGYYTTGIDISEKALEIAKERAHEKGVSVHWQHGSVLDLPFDDNSVAFANDRGCFHHIKEEDRPLYAAEIHRVLMPGALLLLRGCREDDSETFVTITQEKIDRYFSKKKFTHDPVRPITLVSDAGTLLSNLVIVKKRRSNC